MKVAFKQILVLFFLLQIAPAWSQLPHFVQKEIDSLNSRIASEDAPGTITLLHRKTVLYWDYRSIDSVIATAQKIRRVNKRYKTNLYYEVEALFYIANAYAWRDSFTDAERYVASIDSISNLSDNSETKRKALTTKGFISTYKGEPLAGRKYFEKAYTLARENKDDGSVIFTTGIDYIRGITREGDYLLVSRVLNECLTLHAQKTIRENLPNRIQGNFFEELGFLLYSDNLVESKLEQSLFYYQKAYEVYEQYGFSKLALRALYNIAEIQKEIGNLWTAQATYTALIEKSNKANYTRRNKKLYFELGDTHRLLGNTDRALHYFLMSLEDGVNTNQNIQGGCVAEGKCLTEIGKIYLAKQDHSKASYFLGKAKRVMQECIPKDKKEGHVRYVMTAFQRLSEIDSLRGDFKGSMLNFKRFIVFRDSLSNVQNKKAVDELKIAYEAEKKDKEIAELATANNEQKLRAEKQQDLIFGLVVGGSFLLILFGLVLKSLFFKRKSFQIIKEKNDENKLLIREVHHRVKNNLQIIISLLNAQLETHKHNPELTAALLESQNKIRSMALIHQNLYSGNKVSKVRTESYLIELIDHVGKSFVKLDRQVKFETSIQNREIKLGLAIPLGLILNELLTNSFKYAFTSPFGNKVEVNFKEIEDTNTYKLVVRDNGKGLPRDFSIEDSSSFGMQLVQGLVEQLNGTMEIQYNDGAYFEIYLKEPIAA